MNSSFYNGVSGIKSQQFGLDVWANNISNISTIGYRSSTPEFASLFTTTLTDSYFEPTTNNSGLGARAQGTALNMSQGIFQNTDRVFDLAIGGEGWFGVKSTDNQTYYTRAGSFGIDKQGNMVDTMGNYLLGTSGGNITSITLNQDKLEKFGKYYTGTTQDLGNPFSISRLEDITLSSIDTQNKINLPDILYFPPEATTYVNYQANLNPEIKTETSVKQIDANHNIILNSTYPTASIKGTLANETQISDLKEGDVVTLKLRDDANNIISLKTTLDENLNFVISNADISSLEDTTLSLFPELEVVQEVPNVEHFTTEVISPDGNKNILDMTFTKRVPQENLETTWDANIQILKYVEDYKIESYDPSIIYDTTIYNVDIAKGQVTKIYDPALYKVDTGLNKVYEIIDSQTGSATFGGAGELISSNIPTLSNSGEELDINIGTPYATQAVSVSGYSETGTTLTITGNAPNIKVGKSIQIDITDINGRTIKASAVVKEDGSWTAIYENNPLDTTSTLSTNAYNITNNGFDGMISHVDLDKSRRADKDGYIEGFLKNYGMDERGNVIAEFSNGRSAPVAKVAVYHFQNDQGLEKVSSTMFATSSNSGDAIFYIDENGNNILGSDIYSNKLESSNVSMASALTELIIMQKAFDASSKSITTSDQMIQNAINLKR
jgi:flagellar hook protein FlgE